MSISVVDVASLLSGVAAFLTAINTVMLRGNGKDTKSTSVNVNGNMSRLVDILSRAAITIPHTTATKVVDAPPAEVPDDATLEERLATEWLAKLGVKDTPDS
jgi:hypothetical protein